MPETIDVCNEYLEWDKYTKKEFENKFHFVQKPNFNNIREIIIHNGWIEIIFNLKGGISSIYNNVFGTYVKQ